MKEALFYLLVIMDPTVDTVGDPIKTSVMLRSHAMTFKECADSRYDAEMRAAIEMPQQLLDRAIVAACVSVDQFE